MKCLPLLGYVTWMEEIDHVPWPLWRVAGEDCLEHMASLGRASLATPAAAGGQGVGRRLGAGQQAESVAGRKGWGPALKDGPQLCPLPLTLTS